MDFQRPNKLKILGYYLTMLTNIKKLIHVLLRSNKRSHISSRKTREEQLNIAQFRYESLKIKNNCDELVRANQISIAKHKDKMIAHKLNFLDQEILLLNAQKKADDELERTKVIYQVVTQTPD